MYYGNNNDDPMNNLSHRVPPYEAKNLENVVCMPYRSYRFTGFDYLLQKWLEVSSRRRSGPPCCELCQYQYLRHKKFVVSILHFSDPLYKSWL